MAIGRARQRKLMRSQKRALGDDCQGNTGSQSLMGENSISMADNVIPHPKRGLMTEAAIERELDDSPEAKIFQEAIFKAVMKYVDFLHNHNIIWEDSPDGLRLKAQALVVSVDFGTDPRGTFDITLKDGALDRVYGNGINPDPSAFDASLMGTAMQ